MLKTARLCLHYDSLPQTQPSLCSSSYPKPGMYKYSHTYSSTTIPPEKKRRFVVDNTRQSGHRKTFRHRRHKTVRLQNSTVWARQDSPSAARQPVAGTVIHSQCTGLSSQISTGLSGRSSHRRQPCWHAPARHCRGSCRPIPPRSASWPAITALPPSRPPATIIIARTSHRQ
jgi:hypothetical protein